MNRRGFLGAMGIAVAAAVLDPELALWIPGKKTIFIPPAVVKAPAARVGWVQICGFSSLFFTERGVYKLVEFADPKLRVGELAFYTGAESHVVTRWHPDDHCSVAMAGVVIHDGWTPE